MSILGISQLLLTQFWPNFKGGFLGPSLADSNCHGDICPGNICPGNICPVQKYLTCYWHNFYQTFWTQFFKALIYFGPEIFLDPVAFRPKIYKKWTQNYSWQKKIWTNFFLYLRTLNFGSKLFLDTTFLMTNHFFAIFSAIFFFYFKFLWPQIFSPTIFFDCMF